MINFILFSGCTQAEINVSINESLQEIKNTAKKLSTEYDLNTMSDTSSKSENSKTLVDESNVDFYIVPSVSRALYHDYRHGSRDWYTANSLCKGMNAKLPTYNQVSTILESDDLRNLSFPYTFYSDKAWTSESINNRNAYAAIIGDQIGGSVGASISINPKKEKANKAEEADFVCIKQKEGKEKFWNQENRYLKADIDSTDGSQYNRAYQYCADKKMRLPYYNELMKLYDEEKITKGLFISMDGNLIDFLNKDRRLVGDGYSIYAKCIGYR